MVAQVRTLGGRLSFLLNKMQSDEESRVILKEESKKTEAQVSHTAPLPNTSLNLFCFVFCVARNLSRTPSFASVVQCCLSGPIASDQRLEETSNR